MKEIEASVMLHDTPGSTVGDCGHLVDLGAYYLRLHLSRPDGIRYRFDVCSIACLRRVCEKKNIQVRLSGSGYVPLRPYGRQRKRIEVGKLSYHDI